MAVFCATCKRTPNIGVDTFKIYAPPRIKRVMARYFAGDVDVNSIPGQARLSFRVQSGPENPKPYPVIREPASNFTDEESFSIIRDTVSMVCMAWFRIERLPNIQRFSLALTKIQVPAPLETPRLRIITDFQSSGLESCLGGLRFWV